MTALFFLLACNGADPTPPSVPTDTDDTADTDVPIPTADTSEPEPIWPWQLDCEEPGPLPTLVTELPLSPHEDFSFDLAGNLVGVTLDGNLVTQTRDGETTLVAPNLGGTRGARVLADGSVAIANVDLGRIDRVLPTGERVPLADVPAPNGIALDLHDTLWVTTSVGRVVRVTLDGLVTTEVDLDNASLDGIAFSPDYRRLYFNSEFGEVGVLEIDEEGNAVGSQSLFATVPLQGFGILDGMTTDQCGNLYVVRMDGRIYRYLPDGTPAGFLNVAAAIGGGFLPALNFGSGFGGFDRDKLYIMNFEGGVFEADIGIEGRWEPYYPIP